jgi:hypothetical protein
MESEVMYILVEIVIYTLSLNGTLAEGLHSFKKNQKNDVILEKRAKFYILSNK